MHSFSAHALFAVALVGAASVYAADVDPLAVATVKQQFINAKIVPDVVPSFSPVGILGANFNGTSGSINVGEVIAQAGVQTKPVVSVTGNFNSTPSYTVLMIDGNYVGSSNPNGLNLHWLENNVQIGTDGTTSNTTAATIPYAGPAPPSGSGPHRYTILLYAQPASFKAPSSPAPNSGVHLINLATYVSAAGLTGPLAGIYYTVEVGTATVSVESTSAVNPSTLSVSSTASSTGTGTGTTTGKPTGTGTTTSSASTSTTSSGAAVKLGPAAVGGSLMGLFGVVALML